jgi:ABC-type Na+ transport system ATPase subunit NatA
MQEIEAVASRVIIINEGNIILSGDISDLTKDKTLEQVFIDSVLNKEEAEDNVDNI